MFFALMMFLGICNAGVRIARMTYLFKNVDNQFFGRAGSIFFLTNVVFRIILLFIFSIAFFQTDNHIVYAYMIVGGLLFLSSWFLVKHYYSFDRSLSDG